MIGSMVFAISPLTQPAEIEKYCNGECGNPLSGDIRNDIFGNLKTCNQRNCGFEIRRMEISKGVCLRKLGIKQDISKGLSI
jgi:hypothetical protein